MSENVLENPEKIWKIRLPLRILLITFSYCVCWCFLSVFWKIGFDIWTNIHRFVFHYRILSLILVMTFWIPFYLAWKLGSVCKREHLAGYTLIAAWLGYEAQFRVYAYCFPSIC